MEEKKQKTQTFYSNRWKKGHQRSVLLAFNKDTDIEVLNMLDSVPNKTDYVRQLILLDIAEEKKRKTPKE